MQQVQPYLTFYGRCEEALAFYQEKLGAQVLFQMRFDEAPKDMPPCAPEHAKKIMHASFQIGSSILMGSDGDMSKPASYSGFSISITSDDVAAGEKAFNGLADGGKVGMPWQPTFWALGFGMVTDKFGVPWMVNVERPRE
ncbi:VOC family metalloprotein YjdN [Trinickia terrae]|uniref:VOC family metalloprotein YjdN n=1 Tax=Trinickia terrae TaxID=2571161 RepID=A0A4U1HTY2_9BURK|nr:VOC family metalloprotein YjdN [Trinickia terrae]TKC83144.1 VOC family metalloprotein YjdN [Trinickia terrae]